LTLSFFLFPLWKALLRGRKKAPYSACIYAVYKKKCEQMLGYNMSKSGVFIPMSSCYYIAAECAHRFFERKLFKQSFQQIYGPFIHAGEKHDKKTYFMCNKYFMDPLENPPLNLL